MELLTGTIHRLERAAGTRIVVRAGRVWLTESGCLEDVFLDAGDGYVVGGNGRVLLEACGAGTDGQTAAIQIIPPRRPQAPPPDPKPQPMRWTAQPGPIPRPRYRP